MLTSEKKSKPATTTASEHSSEPTVKLNAQEEHCLCLENCDASAEVITRPTTGMSHVTCLAEVRIPLNNTGAKCRPSNTRIFVRRCWWRRHRRWRNDSTEVTTRPTIGTCFAEVWIPLGKAGATGRDIFHIT